MTIKDKRGSNKTSRKPQSEAPKGLPKEKDSLSTPPTAPDRNAAKDQRFKDRWSQLNSDVHSALNYWNDLTTKYDGKLSPDQERLKEIKCLLKDLQKKMKVFND
ncbi:MAG: hypothetical protein JNL11_19780 [Bdellovibrionaceae bacterium]|nr:hypothetical protein [Pseudobdellovibrionaceae bacterium]